MAEYKMTYEELALFVEEAIAKSNGNQSLLQKSKAEILTALTGVFNEEVETNRVEQERLMELWSNIQSERTQALVGKTYVRVYDGVLKFIEAFLTGGLCDTVILVAQGVGSMPTALTASAISSVVFAIRAVIKEAVRLTDDDFCLYLQIVTHFYDKKRFTKSDARTWFPCGRVCNMHTSKWNCRYLLESDECGMSEDVIEKVLEEYCNKGILESTINEREKYYKIKGF